VGTRLLGDVRGPLLRPARAARGLRPAARRGGAAARHLIFAAVVAIGLALQTAAADADTLDRRGYAARLGEAVSALSSARTATASARAPLIDRARALLRETTALRLADGTTVPVDDRAIAARIDASNASIDAALADLTLLREILSRSSTIDPAAADARLRQLVGEHRVQGGQVSFIDALSRWLTRLLSGLGAIPDERIVLATAGGLGLAMLVLVLAILGRGLRERLRREVVLPELATERGADPAQHLREADDAIRAGRPRDAIRALYLFAIATLAARELVRYDPSLTDRELLARARAVPHVEALTELVDLHERVSYGLREARVPDAERARTLALRAVA
jgi:hypothetical protein